MGVGLLGLVLAVLATDSIVKQVMELFHVLFLHTFVLSHEGFRNFLVLVNNMV